MVLTKHPSTLNVYLTPRCNLDCSYCFIDKSGAMNKEVGVDSLKRGLDVFLDFPNGATTINFSGGEPLLRFGKFKALCRHILEKTDKSPALQIILSTNGTLLNKSRNIFLAKNRINFKLSLDGSKKTHDRNRPLKNKGQGSSYAQAVANLGHALRDEYNASMAAVSLVYTPETVADLLENISAIRRLGVKRINFYPSLYAQWSAADLDRLEQVMSKLSKFYISILKSSRKSGGVIEDSLLHDFINDSVTYKPLSCNKIHLGWDGNFYYCDKVFSLPDPERKKFVIGNTQTGINNRLRLKLLEQKRRQMWKVTGTDCRVCKYAKYCFCPVGHYIYFTSCGMDFKKYFPQFCRISKAYIHTFLSIKKELHFLQPSSYAGACLL